MKNYIIHINDMLIYIGLTKSFAISIRSPTSVVVFWLTVFEYG